MLYETFCTSSTSHPTATGGRRVRPEERAVEAAQGHNRRLGAEVEEQGADPAGAAGEGPAGEGGQRLGRQGQVHLRAPRQVQRFHAKQDRHQAQEGHIRCMCMYVCMRGRGKRGVTVCMAVITF